MASGTRPQLPNGFPPCQEVGVSSWWPRRPGGSEEVGAWVSVAQSSGHSRPPGHSGLGDSASIWGQWGPQEGEGVDSWGIPTRGHTEPRPLAHTDVLTHAHSRKRKGSLSKAASPLLATAQKPQEGLSLAGWCWTELALWTPTHGYRVTCWRRQQPLGACAGWGGSLLPGNGDQPAGTGPQLCPVVPCSAPAVMPSHAHCTGVRRRPREARGLSQSHPASWWAWRNPGDPDLPLPRARASGIPLSGLFPHLKSGPTVTTWPGCPEARKVPARGQLTSSVPSPWAPR